MPGIGDRGGAEMNPLADLDAILDQAHIGNSVPGVTTPPKGMLRLPAPTAEPPPPTPRPNSLAHPPDPGNPLLLPGIGQLTIELAAAMEPVPDILTRYNISMPMYRKLMTTPAVRDTIREARAQFTSLSNTAQRIKVKSQLLLEMSLPEIWDIVGDRSIGAAARVAAFTSIKSLTGLEKPETAPVAAKFNLTINVAGQPQTEMHEVPDTTVVIDPDPEPFSDDAPQKQTVSEMLASLRNLNPA